MNFNAHSLYSREDNATYLPASGLALKLTRVPSLVIGIYVVFLLLITAACYLSISNVFLFFCTVLFIAAFSRLLFTKSLLRTHPDAIKHLTFTELGWCFVQFNNNRVIKADIDADSILTEHLVILNLIDQSADSLFSRLFKCYSVILTVNELGSARFRDVKRHLRLINFSKKTES